MRWLRDPQYAAGLLLASAVLGLIAANSPLADALLAAKGAHLPFTVGALDFSAAHWVTDGLLAVFFFVAAIELKHEFTQGELNSVRKALVPTIAACGGVIVPALVYLAAVPEALRGGWPIPTATDIAFALGVLAIAGKRLPSTLRALLLALAVIDDLIAICIIAIFFTSELDVLSLVAAVCAVALVAVLGRALAARPSSLSLRLLVLLACVLAWYFVAASGIHATIAGVACGLVLPARVAEPARNRLEPWTNGLILPVFAFVSASVAIPHVPLGELSPVFWAIAVALPVGKLLGITVAGLAGQAATRVPKAERLGVADLATIGLLGGIGFTVSLLMNELAFRRSEELIAEGTLGVLLGSLVAILVGGGVAAIRSARRPDHSEAELAEERAEYEARYDGEG